MEEVEFMTIMTFDSLDAVREFVGEDHEVAVVPKKARAVLSRFDERAQHYEVRAERSGEGWSRAVSGAPSRDQRADD